MLTPQKQRILDFIRAYRLRHGISPTLQDIADALHIRYRGSVSKHLSALVEKGYLVKPSSGWRGFRLVEDAPDDRFCLPLVGTIAAGCPIEAIAGQDQLDLYDYLLGPNRYLLKVAGDSMIEAGILDGDFVVIQQQGHGWESPSRVSVHPAEEKLIDFSVGRAINYPYTSSLPTPLWRHLLINHVTKILR
jgi:repressor LexA